MEEEVEISNGKKVKIKEIKFVQFSSLDGLNKSDAIVAMLKLGTDLTEEEIKDLSARDGSKVTLAVNRLNGFDTNFQQA